MEAMLLKEREGAFDGAFRVEADPLTVRWISA